MKLTRINTMPKNERFSMKNPEWAEEREFLLKVKAIGERFNWDLKALREAIERDAIICPSCGSTERGERWCTSCHKRGHSSFHGAAMDVCPSNWHLLQP
jgi:hypothetical protein